MVQTPNKDALYLALMAQNQLPKDALKSFPNALMVLNLQQMDVRNYALIEVFLMPQLDALLSFRNVRVLMVLLIQQTLDVQEPALMEVQLMLLAVLKFVSIILKLL